MDKLDKLFALQKEMQELHGNNISSQKFYNDMTLALIDEILEALRETPWKPWKLQQKFNSANCKQELVDAWHFLINLSLAAGMTSNELYIMFEIKNNKNKRRINDKY